MKGNNIINSFLSHSTVYWSIWINNVKIHKTFVLPSSDIELSMKENCRISQSLAMFHCHQFNIIHTEFSGGHMIVSIMSWVWSKPVLVKQAQKKQHLQSSKEIAIHKAYKVVKKVN